MLRNITASRETEERVKLSKNKRLDMYSFYPVDKGNCICQSLISEWKEKMSGMHPKYREDEMVKMNHALVCPRDKSQMTRYMLVCNKCSQVQGYCWATDNTLVDWCDFHYVNWTDGTRWYGCLTPNVSPIDQSLTIECTCGQDTRDFRANMTLPSIIAETMEKENKVGRHFGKTNSKFNVLEVT